MYGLRSGACGCLALLTACTPPADDTSPGPHVVTDYEVLWRTDPAPPVAETALTFVAQVVDQDGLPVEDLQQAHARMLHTVFLPPDLRVLQHVHHEDFAALSADDLRTATFRFPFTPQSGGRFRVAFDFAHRGAYQQRVDWMDVGGDLPAGAPDLARADVNSDGGITGRLSFATPPAAGVRSDWSITLERAADGSPVTNVVPWLDTDGHVVMTNATREWVAHTHAWFPGMDQMAPGHPMPHLYDGPELPFQYVFPAEGTYVLWLQFATSEAPDTAHTLRFVVEVGG